MAVVSRIVPKGPSQLVEQYGRQGVHREFEPQVQRRMSESARGTSLAAGGLTFAVLSWFTKLAMLDIVLFGRIRTGPFFALLRKE